MRRTIRGLLAAALFTPLLAWAQEPDEPSLILPPDPGIEEPEPVQREPTAPPLEEPPPQPAAEVPPPAPPPSYAERDRERRRDRDRAEEREVTVMGQAGLLTYVGEAAAVTSPGATYGVAVGMDLTRGINAELGYVGASYRTEEGEGIAEGRTSLVENGAQPLMKVGPELGQLQPYGMWGFQVSRLNALEAEGENNPLVRDATMFKLPIGAGIAWEVPSDAIADVNVGAQAAYNFALDSGAYPTLDDPLASNQFTTTVMVGGRF